MLLSQSQQYGTSGFRHLACTGRARGRGGGRDLRRARRRRRGEDIAVVVRDVSRRLAPRVENDPLQLSLSDVAAQVGRTPLPALVRDTSAIIERHCIETALQLAHGRRTAAAELLGLSRQSLYMKLSRYGMDGEIESSPGESA